MTQHQPSTSKVRVVSDHVRRFFSGHEVRIERWLPGPMADAYPEFHVLAIAPGPKTQFWVYCSAGASGFVSAGSTLLEFFILAPQDDLRHVELVTMVSWYHRDDRLGFGHTVPLGEPWLPHSKCDHFLISKPYTFGPDLEICNFENSHAHVAWLLPMTSSEREYKLTNGWEALEQLFEEQGVEYWKPNRASLA